MSIVRCIAAVACVLAAAPATLAGERVQTETIEEKGLRIAFTAESTDDGPLMRGKLGRVRLDIRDSATDKPVSGLYPAVWVDAGGEEPLDREACGSTASRYLSGLIGIRPMVDLNSYFVLVMNSDATISVIDPIIGVTGITKLYAQIILPRPGGDWTKSPDEKQLFVTMPTADAVAIVDLETFKMTGSVRTGAKPLRIAMQPDGRFLWVGHAGEAPGVTVIDAVSLEVAAEIPTGRGHHEIAFSADGQTALVTNRTDGTVSLVDVRTLEKTGDVALGGAPISATSSALSQRVYVAEGETGTVAVIDPAETEPAAEIALDPGLGPIRVSQDGRWLLATNPAEDTVYAIDTATNQVRHRIRVKGRPYQVSFTRSFAYVRALDSERVFMIDLADLPGEQTPKPRSFAAGNKPPAKVADLSVADVAVEAPGEAAILVASPGDKTVYYYMEGMNAPMGNFRNYGHQPRAVSVVDRSLQEVEPGIYEATMKMPIAGHYETIFLLDSPSLLHCFRMEAEHNPDIVRDDGPFRLAPEKHETEAGADAHLTFRLISPIDGSGVDGVEDLKVLAFRSPGRDRQVLDATPLGEGRYRIPFRAKEPGGWYFYPASRSKGAAFGDAPYATLLVRPRRTANTGE